MNLGKPIDGFVYDPNRKRYFRCQPDCKLLKSTYANGQTDTNEICKVSIPFDTNASRNITSCILDRSTRRKRGTGIQSFTNNVLKLQFHSMLMSSSLISTTPNAIRGKFYNNSSASSTPCVLTTSGVQWMIQEIDSLCFQNQSSTGPLLVKAGIGSTGIKDVSWYRPSKMSNKSQHFGAILSLNWADSSCLNAGIVAHLQRLQIGANSSNDVISTYPMAACCCDLRVRSDDFTSLDFAIGCENSVNIFDPGSAHFRRPIRKFATSRSAAMSVSFSKKNNDLLLSGTRLGHLLGHDFRCTSTRPCFSLTLTDPRHPVSIRTVDLLSTDYHCVVSYVFQKMALWDIRVQKVLFKYSGSLCPAGDHKRKRVDITDHENFISTVTATGDIMVWNTWTGKRVAMFDRDAFKESPDDVILFGDSMPPRMLVRDTSDSLFGYFGFLGSGID